MKLVRTTCEDRKDTFGPRIEWNDMERSVIVLGIT